MEPKEQERTEEKVCVRCGVRLRPCNCGASGGPHWQDAYAPIGKGSRYCVGGLMHEPGRTYR